MTAVRKISQTLCVVLLCCNLAGVAQAVTSPSGRTNSGRWRRSACERERQTQQHQRPPQGQDDRPSGVVFDGVNPDARSNRIPTLANITNALLPLVPFIAEAPAIATHARLAWPWVRAIWPFFFVPPPLWLPQRRPCKSPPLEDRGLSEGRSRPASGRTSRFVSRDSELREFSILERPRHGEPQASEAVSGRDSPGEDFQPTASSSTRPASRMMSRRLAISGLGACLTALTAAAATAVSAAEEDRAAGRLRQQTGATGVGLGEGHESFGSKAFTRESYDRYAGGYDDLDGGWAASAMGIEDARARLLSRASGRVLEVGVGTGLNLRHYKRGSVSAIDAVDLSPGMLDQASTRAASLGVGGMLRFQEMDAEDLGFPSDCFDTVVDTFSLCVFANPGAALREMARVCKPTGRVLLLENSKSSFGPLAAYQDATASYIANAGGKGCFWNQDVEKLARGSGLRIKSSSPAFPGGLFRALECEPSREGG